MAGTCWRARARGVIGNGCDDADVCAVWFLATLAAVLIMLAIVLGVPLLLLLAAMVGALALAAW